MLFPAKNNMYFQLGFPSSQLTKSPFVTVLQALANVGLRQTDPRLSEMKRSILSVQSSCARDSRFWSNNGLCFDEDIFKGCVTEC